MFHLTLATALNVAFRLVLKGLKIFQKKSTSSLFNGFFDFFREYLNTCFFSFQAVYMICHLCYNRGQATWLDIKYYPALWPIVHNQILHYGPRRRNFHRFCCMASFCTVAYSTEPNLPLCPMVHKQICCSVPQHITKFAAAACCS